MKAKALEKGASLKDSAAGAKAGELTDKFLENYKTPEELEAEGKRLLEIGKAAALEIGNKSLEIAKSFKDKVEADPVGSMKAMLSPVNPSKADSLALVGGALSALTVSALLKPGGDGTIQIPKILMGQFDVDPKRFLEIAANVNSGASTAIRGVLVKEPGKLNLKLPVNIMTQVPALTPKLTAIQNSGMLPIEKICLRTACCCMVCGCAPCSCGGHFEGMACKCIQLRNTCLLCDFADCNPWFVCNCADMYLKCCVSTQLCGCCGLCPAPCIMESRSGFYTCFQQETVCARASLCRCCCGACNYFNEFFCCKITESCCYLFGTCCCLHYRQTCLPYTNEHVPCEVAVLGCSFFGGAKKKQDKKK